MANRLNMISVNKEKLLGALKKRGVQAIDASRELGYCNTYLCARNVEYRLKRCAITWGCNLALQFTSGNAANVCQLLITFLPLARCLVFQ